MTTPQLYTFQIDLSNGKLQTLPGSEGLFTARWPGNGSCIAALQPKRRHFVLLDETPSGAN